MGIWASKAAFEAKEEMMEKRTFFFGGDDNPFKLSDNAIRNKLKQALRTLPEFDTATDE